ncbi:hypothetical protein I4U23_023287 [Adineta vaga]|nr:hypothetical protein I4U23_023287 [Adineta vaga]
MSKAIPNTNIASASDEAHQILLIDSMNAKNTNQKSKFYFSDRFIHILLVIIILLLIAIVILTIFLMLHCDCYSKSIRKQIVSNTIDGNKSISPIDNATRLQEVLAFPRGTYIENDFVVASED